MDDADAAAFVLDGSEATSITPDIRHLGNRSRAVMRREPGAYHGHRMGVLKNAIQEMLSKHPHVARFYPAPQHDGGAGTTIVELRELEQFNVERQASL